MQTLSEVFNECNDLIVTASIFTDLKRAIIQRRLEENEYQRVAKEKSARNKMGLENE